LVCRDPILKKKTLEDLGLLFDSVASVPLQEEVNEVVFCSVNKSAEELKLWVQESAKKANFCSKKAKAKDELLDLNELFNTLNVQKVSPGK